MTTPGGVAPDGAWVLGSDYGKSITEESATATMRGNKLSGYESTQVQLKARDEAVDLIAGQVRDSQIALEGRVDLLEGVQGYCSMYLGNNWNITGNKRITLPFNTQLGPRKGVELVTGNSLQLLSKGLWRCDAHVSFMPPSPTWLGSSTVNIEVYIKVYALSSGVTGSAYSETRYDIAVNSVGPETAAFSKTFVIPTDNLYGVCVQVYQPKSTLIGLYGGTLRSALSVNKWDNGTINGAPLDTVIDGGTLS
jgi:hypothetical protein